MRKATYLCLNPLKRVKFISIRLQNEISQNLKLLGLNPLKRVKFISIKEFEQFKSKAEQ